LRFKDKELVQCGGNKDTVLSCVKRTA